jgi:MurNAc alpha-1-phosphate uridylyltransferase
MSGVLLKARSVGGRKGSYNGTDNSGLQMKAMILAAGRGERMGALTATLPKPLLNVGGTTLIEHHLQRLAAIGIHDIVINLSYRAAQIRAAIGDGRRWSAQIQYSEEGEPPLETGGGIVHALPLLGAAPFLLVNSDVFTDFDLTPLLADSARNTLVLVPNPAHHPNGDFGLDDAGVVTATPPLLTYAGVAVFDPGLFTAFAPGRQPLKPILDEAIRRRDLRGLRYDGMWMDIGTPERLQGLNRLLGTRKAPR